jgi:hypothetical protein
MEVKPEVLPVYLNQLEILIGLILWLMKWDTNLEGTTPLITVVLRTEIMQLQWSLEVALQ